MRQCARQWLHLVTLGLIAGFSVQAVHAKAAQTIGEAPQALILTGQYEGTHDPSIAEEHGKYYVFATGAAAPLVAGGTSLSAVPAPSGNKPAIKPDTRNLPQLPIRCSDDLRSWIRCGEVFPAVPAWIEQMSPKTSELWAPDISYFDGQYHLYYAFSVFGKNTSGIALATNVTLDRTSAKYKWVDRGLVIRSFATDNFNAIDPNVVIDAKGRVWLSFGSFWTGIKMRSLDRKTGLLSASNSELYSLASRGRSAENGPRHVNLPPDSEAVEAPFVFRHGSYYYLFVSWDLCCRGAKSTYRTMVGRSKSVTGPYVDREGMAMEKGGGSPVLVGNTRWAGPGGESLMHLRSEDLIVFHAYGVGSGRPALHISTLGWKNGWPSAALEGEGSRSR